VQNFCVRSSQYIAPWTTVASAPKETTTLQEPRE
jgi:hypothetical protein